MTNTTTPLSGGIPVGAIVAYAGELKPLPSEWRLCDGSELSVADFPDLYAAIGNANGGSGNSFRVPDLQGRFLRGESHCASHIYKIVCVQSE
jgi:microcystin-dependent protein